jgi:TRAP-type C4-dicarboxylate transport system permease small subunit
MANPIGTSAQAPGVEPTDPVLRLNGLEKASLALACLCCVLIGVLSLADVVLRTAKVEFHIAGEGSTILLAWLLFLVLPAATRRRAHLSLGYFDTIAPAWLRKSVRIFGHLVMLVYVVTLMWFLGRMAMTSLANDLRSSSILRLPLIYAQSGVILGLGLLTLTQVSIMIRDILTPAATGQTEPGAAG